MKDVILLWTVTVNKRRTVIALETFKIWVEWKRCRDCQRRCTHVDKVYTQGTNVCSVYRDCVHRPQPEVMDLAPYFPTGPAGQGAERTRCQPPANAAWGRTPAVRPHPVLEGDEGRQPRLNAVDESSCTLIKMRATAN